MRLVKAFILVSVLSIFVSALVTIAALLFSSKANPPQSSNFNLFGGYEFVVAIFAGSIYGGAIGIVIGLFSGAFFVVVVQNLRSSTSEIFIIITFAFLIGLLEYFFFYTTNKSQFEEDKLILPFYLIVSGFLTSFLPQVITKKYLIL